MATPTQAPTKVPQEPDPFYYDYDTVQTVGMTLATILFLLGILIIITQHANPVSRSFLPQPLEVAVCKTSPGHLHCRFCLSAEA
uniref:FXYD domain-containing ion transport regulator n=1 Tax=Lynx canadensis TaxID=61383 RepID=A0A667IA40_LYNCA